MRFAESQSSNSSQLDFVPRERRSQIVQMIVAFAVAIAAVFIIASLGVHHSTRWAVAGPMLVVALLCFYVVFGKQRNLDLVMTTEYQNMLFAQAASLGAALCLFVKRDGAIVYANDGLRNLFPDSSYGTAQSLEAVFQQGGVAKNDRERAMQAVYNGTTERVVFPITSRDGKSQDYILTVEPLARPAGFSVIRAREYRDTRAGTQLLPDVLRSTSADKLDHLLAKTPVAHFVTDGYGGFEYVNPALEQMLGFSAGAMLAGKVSLKQVLHRLAGQPVGEDYVPTDFRGEALLQKRQGELISVLLNQAVIRDSAGRPQGITGSVLPITGKQG